MSAGDLPTAAGSGLEWPIGERQARGAARSASRSGTALIVVDDEAVARATAMLLAVVGYDALAACDSEQATRRLRESALTPDILICDDYLASGETGIEAIRSIRNAVRQTVPAVLATWEAAGPLEEAASQTAECSVLRKPVAVPALLELVAGFWRHHARVRSSGQQAAESGPGEPGRACGTRNAPAIDEAVAILAHELRSPLAAIGSALEVWRSQADSEMQRRARESADRQLRKAVGLIGELLEFSRTVRGHPIHALADVDLSQVVTNCVDELSHALVARRHVLSLDLPPQRVLVRGESSRLEQVVVNLVGNSAKFTPEGGRIEVRLACEAGEAVLSVRDNGIGIEPQMLSAIFEPFVQLARLPDPTTSSLGIGLTVTRRIVELHGGTVEARSAGHGAGSEFVVRLPRAPRPTT